MVDVQRQASCNECGLFAIANMATFAFGHSPAKVKYDQLHMEDHLVTFLIQQEYGRLSFLDSFVIVCAIRSSITVRLHGQCNYVSDL